MITAVHPGCTSKEQITKQLLLHRSNTCKDIPVMHSQGLEWRRTSKHTIFHTHKRKEIFNKISKHHVASLPTRYPNTDRQPFTSIREAWDKRCLTNWHNNFRTLRIRRYIVKEESDASKISEDRHDIDLDSRVDLYSRVEVAEYPRILLWLEGGYWLRTTTWILASVLCLLSVVPMLLLGARYCEYLAISLTAWPTWCKTYRLNCNWGLRTGSWP